MVSVSLDFGERNENKINISAQHSGPTLKTVLMLQSELRRNVAFWGCNEEAGSVHRYNDDVGKNVDGQRERERERERSHLPRLALLWMGGGGGAS